MSFLKFQPTELESELISLGNDLNQSDTEDKPNDPSNTTSSSSVEGKVTNSVIQSNAVGLFGPGVSEFWVKKKKRGQTKRVRRGLTKGMKLPENVENLLGTCTIHLSLCLLYCFSSCLSVFCLSFCLHVGLSAKHTLYTCMLF